MVRKWTSLALLAVVLSACASGPSYGRQRRTNVITADELATITVSNLYQAIDRLRPRWLQVRAQRSFSTTTAIVVYQGQTYLGGTDILRQLGVEGVQELRYLDGPTASATLPGIGTRQVEGAIVINPQ